MEQPVQRLIRVTLVISILVLGVTVLYLLPDTIRMVSRVVLTALGFA
jgi:hypothetical protein